MKTNLLYTLALLAVLLQNACSPAECFKRTGEIVKEERVVSDFNTLLINDNVEVTLRNDSSNTVIVEAGKNLISSIKTEVEGSILKITNENSCNWARSYNEPVRVSVGARFIKRIEQFGFNAIKTSELLEVDNLNIVCKNSGDITLNLKANNVQLFTSSTSYINLIGSTKTALLHTNGMGEMYANKLSVDDLIVVHENLNDVHVFPIKSLNVTFNSQNKGNVLYYNEPESITIEGSGIGKVIKK
jgi:hypothetical protein